ncbi:TetR-like C-terminal domain-containing protein [Micromonospora sp. WMMD714]|uniref:TetR/AcrR family transcriptional regulator n=1 Tax=Micromonospora sp. WMMD714 TaxID=3016097 RepID=UPI00249A92E7|nr:TetR-like C-terminal domain-containing protein [Micromonospora sp. WMMD714]WFE65478.1 TetR-like C-terminal domain-containing protein [Micromonospora sp. WMMD714]
MPRAGLTTEVVIERGSRLLEAHPTDELTLAALAESLGVRVPSLYKHVDGLPGLRRGIMLRAKEKLAAALTEACIGRARADAVRSLAAAYRAWARENPMQYPMTIRAPDPDDAEDQRASASALHVVYTVLAGYHLVDDDAIDATRFLRAAIHGFVSLETAGAFRLAADLERSYDRTIDSVVTALETWPRP